MKELLLIIKNWVLAVIDPFHSWFSYQWLLTRNATNLSLVIDLEEGRDLKEMLLHHVKFFAFFGFIVGVLHRVYPELMAGSTEFFVAKFIILYLLASLPGAFALYISNKCFLNRDVNFKSWFSFVYCCWAIIPSNLYLLAVYPVIVLKFVFDVPDENWNSGGGAVYLVMLFLIYLFHSLIAYVCTLKKLLNCTRLQFVGFHMVHFWFMGLSGWIAILVLKAIEIGFAVTTENYLDDESLNDKFWLIDLFL